MQIKSKMWIPMGFDVGCLSFVVYINDTTTTTNSLAVVM